ncbi:MAG: LPS assembly protein LptD [Magnetospirillum sp.]|nr:LPS assembly protein LptD [Magnetospirillum sp.]
MRAKLPFLVPAVVLAALQGTRPAAADSTLFGQQWPEAGSWGQAWSDDDQGTATGSAPSPPPPAPQAAAPPSAADSSDTADTGQPQAASVPASATASAPAPAFVPQGAAPSPQPSPIVTAPTFAQTAAPQPDAPSSAADSGDTADTGQPQAAPVPASAPASAPAPAFVPQAAAPSLQPSPIMALPAAAQTAAPTFSPSPNGHAGPATNTTPTTISAPAGTNGEPDQPVRLTADQIINDRDLGIVTAKGKVVIVQGGNTLTANTVSYNLKQDIISAAGNVVLTEPTGEVTYSDYVELSGDFKNGVAQEIRMIMADHSRLVAASATRVNSNRTDFDDAAYTACEPCREHPERTPLWQAKAATVTHDKVDHTIEYHDAWLEFEGVPIAYTPYLSHPDPTVKRQSGFLTPSVGMNSLIGPSIATPYYWVINDQQDLTFSPRWMLNQFTSFNSGDAPNAASAALQRVVLAGEHRWNGEFGQADTIASLTADPITGNLRGHVNAWANFAIDDNWRAGYIAQHQSDDTYSLIYGYTIPADQPWLTTQPYIERFDQKDYFTAEGFLFQGLAPPQDNSALNPVVLPHLAYQHVSAPDQYGATWTVNSDLLSYTRQQGTSASRVVNQVQWDLPYTTLSGQQYTFTSSLTTDGYHFVGLPGYGDGYSGRVVPMMAINWRYPIVSDSTTLPQVITPIVMVAASPNGANNPRIPNEDSADFVLDDTNIFLPNRLAGYDLVEDGVRGAYGMRWAAYPYRGGELDAQIAQAWQAHPDGTFAVGSGMSSYMSDYIARADFMPAGNIGFHDRVRLDRHTFEANRNEASVTAGPPAFNVGLTYGYFAKTSPDAFTFFPTRQYGVLAVNSTISRYWSVQTSYYQDMATEGGPLTFTANVIYNDDCFALVSSFTRNYTYLNDYQAGYTMMFNIVFKSLGDIPFRAF